MLNKELLLRSGKLLEPSFYMKVSFDNLPDTLLTSGYITYPYKNSRFTASTILGGPTQRIIYTFLSMLDLLNSIKNDSPIEIHTPTLTTTGTAVYKYVGVNIIADEYFADMQLLPNRTSVLEGDYFIFTDPNTDQGVPTFNYRFSIEFKFRVEI